MNRFYHAAKVFAPVLGTPLHKFFVSPANKPMYKVLLDSGGVVELQKLPQEDTARHLRCQPNNQNSFPTFNLSPDRETSAYEGSKFASLSRTFEILEGYGVDFGEPVLRPWALVRDWLAQPGFADSIAAFFDQYAQGEKLAWTILVGLDCAAPGLSTFDSDVFDFLSDRVKDSLSENEGPEVDAYGNRGALITTNFAKTKIPGIGNISFFERNKALKTMHTYGMVHGGVSPFPLRRETEEKIRALIDFLFRLEHKDRLWQSIARQEKGKKDRHVTVFYAELPHREKEMADVGQLLFDLSQGDDLHAHALQECREALKAFRGEAAAPRNTKVRLFSFVKPHQGPIWYTSDFRMGIEDFADRTDEWIDAMRPRKNDLPLSVYRACVEANNRYRIITGDDGQLAGERAQWPFTFVTLEEMYKIFLLGDEFAAKKCARHWVDNHLWLIVQRQHSTKGWDQRRIALCLGRLIRRTLGLERDDWWKAGVALRCLRLLAHKYDEHLEGNEHRSEDKLVSLITSWLGGSAIIPTILYRMQPELRWGRMDKLNQRRGPGLPDCIGYLKPVLNEVPRTTTERLQFAMGFAYQE